MNNVKFFQGIVLVLGLTIEFAFATNSNNICGLLSILKPEFYPASVINGTVYWESGYMMSVWDLWWKRNYPDLNELMDAEHAPALVRVVDRLFHRPPNTKGVPSDFRPSHRIARMNPVALANIIGTFSGLISDLPDILNQVLAAKNIQTDNEQFVQIIKDLNKVDCVENLLDLDSKYANRDTKNQKNEIVELINNIKFINLFKKTCKNLTLTTVGEQKDLLKSIQNNAKETHMALLALLWCVCGTRKQALAEYYKKFEEVYKLKYPKVSIFVNDSAPNWETWAQSRFSLNSKNEYVGDVLAGKVISSSDMSTFNPELFEKFVWVLLMPGKYPKTTGYGGNTELWLDGKKQMSGEKTLTFSDCMDTAIMSFILILAYNRETGMFEIEQLRRRGIKSLHPKLEAFLRSDHPAFGGMELIPQTIDSPEVHSAWSEVSSNVPGALYNTGSPQFIVKVKGRPRIFVNPSCPSEFIEKFIEKDWYPFGERYDYVTKMEYDSSLRSTILYSLEPYLKNLVILLNYLFNLNLYENVYEEVSREDFLKINLGKLESSLGIKFQHIDASLHECPVISRDDIDRYDNVRMEHNITFFDNEPNAFYFETFPGHAYIDALWKRENIVGLDAVIKQLPNDISMLPCVRGIKLKFFGFKNLEEAGKNLFLTNGTVKMVDLFWKDKWGRNEKTQNFINLFLHKELESDTASFLGRYSIKSV